MPLASSSTVMIVAELVSPGFTDDLSTWTFWIDATGAATQQATVANCDNLFHGDERSFTTRLTPDEVSKLIAAASAGGFARLESEYSADNEHRVVTDLETSALAFRIGGELKRVQVYGAGFLAYEGSQEMKLYRDLWREIERYLPYGGS